MKMVDSREVGCVCIYSSWVKCLTQNEYIITGIPKRLKWQNYPYCTASVTCRFIPEEISYFDRKTHTGPEHKNHELIPFRRLVLLHYSRFGRYEVSSVVSKVKVWNPASAVTNFMESPLCRDLKTNDSDMVFSFFLERDGPWLLSNLGGFFFYLLKIKK